MIKLGIEFTPPNDRPSGGAVIRSLAAFKAGFLDRARVKNAVAASVHDRLLQIGAITRTIAQRSMRRRKSASKPGQPPSARLDNLQGGGLRDWILFALEPGDRSLIVGPIGFNSGRTGVPALHEFGGSKKNERRKTYKIGMAGPIRAVSGLSVLGGKADYHLVAGVNAKIKRKTTKGPTRYQKQFTDLPTKPWVTFVKIRTNKQLQRVEGVDEMLFGPRTLHYPPRPYMRPAFETARQKYASLFANSVH